MKNLLVKANLKLSVVLKNGLLSHKTNYFFLNLKSLLSLFTQGLFTSKHLRAHFIIRMEK